ncbi:MAG: bifunctional hydroxymethylpyrimidine kinase/phosphomethylpyrimidine kinase [Nitrospirae bacterium]|nr:bifunctional hydroxymethylpyrimidine kinase/phosphomethylpyrimidine kinase [Nitrospirota bacterium]
MKRALSIAGSDPSGGAGIQMDLKVFKHFDVYGLSMPAALTAQNSFGVRSVYPIERAIIKDQLDVLVSDIRPDALKTGMLLTPAAVEAVAEYVEKYRLANLVIDPVLRSSSGAEMLDNRALDAMRSLLLPLCRIITPNIREAGALAGIEIKDHSDMRAAAETIIKSGAQTVIITGGHLDELDKSSQNAADLFFDGSEFRTISSKMFKGEFHGTGCAYSAAITALLAKGLSVFEAAERAKEFMNSIISNAVEIGRGAKYLNV